jgi:hypothetical protein
MINLKPTFYRQFRSLTFFFSLNDNNTKHDNTQ